MSTERKQQPSMRGYAHIGQSFIRGYARLIRPLNALVADDLESIAAFADVLSAQRDIASAQCAALGGRLHPYLERERMDFFVEHWP